MVGDRSGWELREKGGNLNTRVYIYAVTHFDLGFKILYIYEDYKKSSSSHVFI